MNAREIEYIEARLPAGLQTMPSPEQMLHLANRAKRERSRHMAATFAWFVGKVAQAVRIVRDNAVACTAARLQHKTA